MFRTNLNEYRFRRAGSTKNAAVSAAEAAQFSNVLVLASPWNTVPDTIRLAGDLTGKGIARGLADDLGFEPVDAGPLSQARLLEPLALLWITMAVKYGFSVNFAFKLMRR